MTKSRLNSLELEKQEMKSTICPLNSELADAKNILADNQPLVSLGAQLSKLDSINKRPPSLDMDRFYATDQAVITKASPEAISLGGGLILSGLLSSFGINYTKIIYRISNFIPIPSNLRYVAKKDREAAFMRVSGFVCNYP